MYTEEINGRIIELPYTEDKEAAKRIKKAIKFITGKSFSVTTSSTGYIDIRLPNKKQFSEEEYEQALGKVFKDGEYTTDFFLISTSDRAYWLYYLENYDVIQEEKEAIQSHLEETYARIDKINKEFEKLGREELTIDEDRIKEVNTEEIIELARINYNKQNTLGGYLREFELKDYTVQKFIVGWELTLTNDEYDIYTNNLLDSQMLLKNKCESLDEYIFKIVKVVSPGKRHFYIDTQGYDYARYVLLPLVEEIGGEETKTEDIKLAIAKKLIEAGRQLNQVAMTLQNSFNLTSLESHQVIISALS